MTRPSARTGAKRALRAPMATSTLEDLVSGEFRRVIPDVESSYRSSAGYTADMGVDHGGTSQQGGNG